MSAQIDRLIINSPYVEPSRHWHYDRQSRTFSLDDGRRPAGYVKATEGSKAFDDPGIFVELPLVNQIRGRVKAWREAGYPGVTGTTKRLLDHWNDADAREGKRFFFCQLEAIETLIWLSEAPAAERQGIAIPGDGGAFTRICAKMATGSGKTIVMALVITWQVLNKVAYPQDKRFSRNIFVVAPGLTVKSRLRVLLPEAEGNYYEQFQVVPPGLMDKLRQGKVLVRNWHAFNWETEDQLAKKRTVDQRQKWLKSDEVYAREALGELAHARNILVINDEAHHAWRVPAGSKIRGVRREEIDAATKWVGGLDRIHTARGIQTCYDFSATPFAPSGKKSRDEALFGWIVSDFGLNDAIESGLVKTPRVVVRDDAIPDVKTFKSKLYHIYAQPEVHDDLNRKAQEHESLPDLVINGYALLGHDWLETKKKWEKAGHKVPPVMITVANRTETAARIKYAFDHNKLRVGELAQAERTLHIDSKVLDKAEAQDELVFMGVGEKSLREVSGEDDEAPQRKMTKKEQAEWLRRQVDSVGQLGKPGAEIQNVISVGMLSEGWDAKTVTHIMGLRAFSSQLLCEQVVGRGLRRTSYDVNPGTGLFDPEYVNIFGVPFTFLPHEGGEGAPPPPPNPKSEIKPLIERTPDFKISWPNVMRIDHLYTPRLVLDLSQVPTLALDASANITMAEIAATLEGKPDLEHRSEIDLQELGHRYRRQKIVFEVARDLYDDIGRDWKGSKEFLLAQLVAVIERFIDSNRITIQPALFERDELRRRIIITLNMNKLVQHIGHRIREQNSELLTPIFDSERPIRSTGDMAPWYTGRPCEQTKRSHINLCVFDSTWESCEAFILDHDSNVQAWVKNDHLGFEITYVYDGIFHKFRPDFLIRMTSGKVLVLEVKGRDTMQNRAKREFLDEWTRAVNQHGEFGTWCWDVSFVPSDVRDILVKHNIFAKTHMGTTSSDV